MSKMFVVLSRGVMFLGKGLRDGDKFVLLFGYLFVSLHFTNPIE